MSFNPALVDTREEYALAIALGYDWVAQAHAGEPVTLAQMNLEQHPFTVVGRYVLIREVSLDHAGRARYTHRGDHVIRRVRYQPLPTL